MTTKGDSLLSEAIERRTALQGLLLTWGSRNYRELPWRRERTPYRILLAEVVLRRTTATAAGRIYERLAHKYPTLVSLSRAPEEELSAELSTVGYQNQRAKILKAMSAFILKKFGGKIPANKEDLLSIPHVGPYTAGAILCLGYGIPSAMVDSNIQRIAGRLFSDSLQDKVSYHVVLEVMESIIPRDGCDAFNFAMLDLGALVCKYGRPRHDICPLSSLCDSAYGAIEAANTRRPKG